MDFKAAKMVRIGFFLLSWCHVGAASRTGQVSHATGGAETHPAAPAGNGPSGNPCDRYPSDSQAQHAASQRGFDFMTRTPMLAPVMNQEIFDQLYTAWPEMQNPADRATFEQLPTAEKRSRIASHYGLLPAPYDNQGVPMGFTPSSRGWSVNCLLCHAGAAPSSPGSDTNVTVPGLDNSQLEFGALMADVRHYLQTNPGFVATDPSFQPLPRDTHYAAAANQAPAFVQNGTGTTFLSPAGPQSITEGESFAFLGTEYFGQFRDPHTMALSPSGFENNAQQPWAYHLTPEQMSRDAITKPARSWFNLPHESRLYYDGAAPLVDANGAGRAVLGQFLLGPQEGPDGRIDLTGNMAADWVNAGRGDEILQYICSLSDHPPTYPGPIDRSRWQNGCNAFYQPSNCVRCHGVNPGTGLASGTLRDVGTDPAGIHNNPDYANFARTLTGDQWRISDGGRPAPPITLRPDLWISPLLHNGSTDLQSLVTLPPEQRPSNFTRLSQYDWTNHRWAIQELTPGQMQGRPLDSYLNTGLPGNSHQGHDIGELVPSLSADQRQDIVQYLLDTRRYGNPLGATTAARCGGNPTTPNVSP